MALPASGQMAISDVNVELKRPWNYCSDLNNSEIRKLAKKPSGIIAMSDLHGKANSYPVQTGVQVITNLHSGAQTDVDYWMPAASVATHNYPYFRVSLNANIIIKHTENRDGTSWTNNWQWVNRWNVADYSFFENSDDIGTALGPVGHPALLDTTNHDTMGNCHWSGTYAVSDIGAGWTQLATVEYNAGFTSYLDVYARIENGVIYAFWRVKAWVPYRMHYRASLAGTIGISPYIV